MKHIISMIFFALISLLLLARCEKSTEQMMQEYIEFYYPSTGIFTYEIVFDWGIYLIATGADSDDKLHMDSELYRGYITIRPFFYNPENTLSMPIYLVTPAGEVWITKNGKEIPENKYREEITEKESESGTMISTVSLTSPLEPIVDHFFSNRELWEKYGALIADNGKYSLKLIDE
ncbi:MAG: hypothetical protein JXR46_16980 [Calditrichaceae bacterium]|nr:hypothetical protein [Calditrichaceae bacterium]MBN2710743.1 hypothetical protein [Calditrichaceae bacterium]RQV95695.1 MAG: hypothetical protein EH224_06675 [Calditrichota bacterium]